MSGSLCCKHYNALSIAVRHVDLDLGLHWESKKNPSVISRSFKLGHTRTLSHFNNFLVELDLLLSEIF